MTTRLAAGVLISPILSNPALARPHHRTRCRSGIRMLATPRGWTQSIHEEVPSKHARLRPGQRGTPFRMPDAPPLAGSTRNRIQTAERRAFPRCMQRTWYLQGDERYAFQEYLLFGQ